MRSIITAGICLALLTVSTNGHSFSLDVAPGEVAGELRLDDLAVTDTAYFRPTDFCINDGSLYLPSNVSLSSRSEYAFSIRIKLLPGNRVEAETVTPSNKFEFNSDDVDRLIQTLREPIGMLFALQPLYCSDYDDVNDENMVFFKLLTIDGHDSLSALIEDLRSRDYEFASD